MPEKHIVVTELIPNASDALNQVVISTGYTETDAINRAIQLSALVERKLSEGQRLAFVTVNKAGEVMDVDVVDIKKHN